MEDWYIFGQIHGKGKRELLGSSTFKATFIEPRITFNKRELTFRIDMCPNGEELSRTGRKSYDISCGTISMKKNYRER